MPAQSPPSGSARVRSVCQRCGSENDIPAIAMPGSRITIENVEGVVCTECGCDRSFVDGFNENSAFELTTDAIARRDRIRGAYVPSGQVIRGIIPPPLHSLGQSDHELRISDLDPNDLRHYLLFWDRIDIPDMPIMSVGLGDDCSLLEAEGILQRSIIGFEGPVNLPTMKDLARLADTVQVGALLINNTRPFEKWSLARSTEILTLDSSLADMVSGVELHLSDALRIPTADVPIEQVLRFKEDREAELHALRAELDEIVHAISDHPNTRFAEDEGIRRIENALVDYNRALTEERDWSLRSIKLKLNISDAKWELSSAALHGLYAGSIELAAVTSVIGYGIAVLRANAAQLRKPKGIPDDLQAYAYLHQVRGLGRR